MMTDFFPAKGNENADKSNSKRKASAPVPAPKKKPTKKKKKSEADRYKKCRIEPIPRAEYNDQCLECLTLQDGRQVVLSCEVYDINDANTALGKFGKLCYFTTVPQLGKESILVGFGYGSESTLTALSLPDCSPLGECADLTGLGRIASDKQMNNRLIVSTGEKDSAEFHYLNVDQAEFRTLSSFNLAAMGIRNTFGRAPEMGLWHCKAGIPYVLVASGGKLVIVSLQDLDKPAVVAMTSQLHYGTKRVKQPGVFGMTFYQPATGMHKVLTAGSDGAVAIVNLDGESFAAEDSISVTMKGVICNNVAVHSGLGVVATSSNFMNEMNFWDLSTLKRIKKIKGLGDEMRRGKFIPFCIAFAEDGTCAFSNSNDVDESPLRLIQPEG